MVLFLRQFDKKILIPCLLILASGLTGCDKVQDFIHRIRYPASAAASTVTPSNSTPNDSNADTSPNMQTSANSSLKAEAVSYPFSQWQQLPVTSLPVKDITQAKQFLTQQFAKNGTKQAPTVDPKSLDFASNLATQYRFTANTAPYFDLIDSPQYVELGWYYASANDQSAEKKQAITYAGHAYQLARSWFGDPAGAKLIQAILAGEVVKNQTINGIKVVQARCEAFSCMLVLKKS